MRASRHDPLQLDVAAFAAEGQQLSGQWPGSSLARLVEVQVPPQDGALAEVDWQAQGERLAVPGSEPEIWLTLTVSTPVWLTCQRCLQAMALPLTLNRRLRFVSGESQAEAMDAELEDDVLALSRSLDLRDLVEDELLLALPLVPRHEVCPQPLPMAADLDVLPDEPAGKPNPFAALRSLKTGGSGSGSD